MPKRRRTVDTKAVVVGVAIMAIAAAASSKRARRRPADRFPCDADAVVSSRFKLEMMCAGGSPVRLMIPDGASASVADRLREIHSGSLSTGAARLESWTELLNEEFAPRTLTPETVSKLQVGAGGTTIADLISSDIGLEERLSE